MSDNEDERISRLVRLPFLFGVMLILIGIVFSGPLPFDVKTQNGLTVGLTPINATIYSDHASYCFWANMTTPLASAPLLTTTSFGFSKAANVSNVSLRLVKATNNPYASINADNVSEMVDNWSYPMSTPSSEMLYCFNINLSKTPEGSTILPKSNPFNISINSKLADPNPGACGATLSSANTVYTMTINETYGGSSQCYEITANNITLDCAGYSITGNAATGYSGVYSNQLNSTIKNCVIINFTTGINLSSASNNSTIYNNQIGNINGATGTTGTNGGPGASVYGIYALSSFNNISSNNLTNMQGGAGGSANSCAHCVAGNGGYGGTSTAIYLASSSSSVSSNIIQNISGGAGGTGGNAEYDTTAGKGGTGNISAAIYLSSGSNIVISQNVLSNITGGNGGNGGFKFLAGAGTPGGNGSFGGSAYGVYLGIGANISATNNGIYNISGGGGGSGGYNQGTGGSYGNGGNGTTGAIAYAIGVFSSSNFTLFSNTITNITGGNGGNGGFMGTTYYDVGGAGAQAFSVYANNSNSGNASGNSITNLTGGVGGISGNSGQAANSTNSTAFYLSSMSGNNTFLDNNMSSLIWVNDTNGTNYYNNSSSGNIYYFSNGTASWSVFNISSSTMSNWADQGTSRPFNATTVGGNFTGAGRPQDWYPYTGKTNTNSTNITAISVYPSSPNVNNNLSCNITANDTSDAAMNVSVNWTKNGVYNTTINTTGVVNNTVTLIANLSHGNLSIGDNWSCAAQATSSTSTSNWVVGANVTVTNTVSVGAVVFSPNGTSFIYGPVEANVTSVSMVNSTLNLSYNWFKNGANQTSLAGYQIVANNSITTLDAPPTFTIGDNWSISVWANDGTSNSSVVSSANTTILNYFSSVNLTTPASAYSGLSFNATLNLTLAGAPSASAYFVFNTSNTTGTDSGAHPIWSFLTTATAPVVATPTNFTGTWYYRATLANGSYYETSNNTTNVSVGISGFVLCNATYPTTAINYIFLDSITHVPVNASLVSAITWAGGVNSLTEQNDTVSICVNPASMNVSATISETATATGYYAYYSSRPAANYSNATVNYTIYLINTTFGGYYSFRTINPYNAPITNASVVIASVGNSTVVFNGTTDITGNVYTPLTQLQIYTVSASADGYIPRSFLFTAGAVTATDILLNTNTTNTVIPNFDSVWNDVSYSVLPSYHFLTNTTNLTLVITSNNSSLASWGMNVSYSVNGTDTLVYSNNSIASIGGSMFYTANQTGTYFVTPWFIETGFAQYTPPNVVYIYGNQTGLAKGGALLQTGTVISGFSYYLIAIVLAMMAALWVSQYTGGAGAAIVGLVILAGATILWPDAPVVNLMGKADITATMMTVLVGLVTIAAIYISQYGV